MKGHHAAGRGHSHQKKSQPAEDDVRPDALFFSVIDGTCWTITARTKGPTSLETRRRSANALPTNRSKRRVTSRHDHGVFVNRKVDHLDHRIVDWTCPKMMDSPDEKIVFSTRRFTCG
jgi:hypothetical protein